jgi:hypothetical protein
MYSIAGRVFWRIAPPVISLADQLLNTTLSRPGLTVRVSLVPDRWRGTYTGRYGPNASLEYLCVGPVPFLRIEVWRRAR